MSAWIGRTGHLLAALPLLDPLALDGVIAREVRNADFLAPAYTPLLAQVLRAARQASGNPMIYRLGLHAKKPPIEEQLPLLRTLWPGPLVCRWNLHRRHGAYGYESAKAQYAPFDLSQDLDTTTRAHFERVIIGICGARKNAYVAINSRTEEGVSLLVMELDKKVAC